MRRILCQLSLVLLVPLLACDKPTPVAPIGTTLTISANPTRISINNQTSSITVIVRKEDGTPVNPGTQVNFSTTLGSIDQVAETNDNGVAVATLIGDGRVGIATVTASSGAAAVVTVDLQIGSLAASISLSATPKNIPKDISDNQKKITLQALVRDDTGAPLADAVVNFLVDIGSLDSQGAAVITNENGEATDKLAVTQTDLSVLEDSFFEVRAQTAGDGGALIEASEEIQISGVASSIVLSVNPGSIPEAGGTVQLLAIVRDSLGDGLAGAQVNFQTDLGSLFSGGSLNPTDSKGEVPDTLTVTQADLNAFSGNAFNVSAQTGGIGGVILEDTKSVQIVSSAPLAAFTFSGASGSMTVDFLFTGSGDEPLTFAWDFENDGTVDSTLRNPSHTYLTTGGKTVLLTVTNVFGTNQATTSIQIPLP
jgi:hypothetical protein